jgi:imidazolonepropionase
MKLITHLNQILTLENAFHKSGKNLKPEDLSLIEDASIVFGNDKIYWVGKSSELPDKYKKLTPISGNGYVLTPELVDAHTHLVFGGNRANEYAQRLNGKSYEEIAKSGGGILFTVSETVKLSEEELFQSSVKKINSIHQYGVGTIEIKTGYALTTSGEKKLLKVIDRLKKFFSPKIQIITTFMAAHAVPAGQTSKDYIQNCVIPLLESEQELIDCVDIFHEMGYFTTQDVHELFKVAQKLKKKIKIHADEFNDNDGAKIATQYQAVSADHLLKISDGGIKFLSDSNTVATLLPGTALFLGKPWAPAKKLLDHGVCVAIASDYNPGSCHYEHLLKIASLAAPSFGMNQAQLWSSITLNAAKALGLLDQGAIVTYGWSENFCDVNLLNSAFN